MANEIGGISVSINIYVHYSNVTCPDEESEVDRLNDLPNTHTY